MTAMKDADARIARWLSNRPTWLQEAAVRLLSHRQLSESDISDIANLLKTDSGPKKATRSLPHLNPASTDSAVVSQALRLVSIGAVEGIENLAPRVPLHFGDKLLAVVYGGNGSGKSGYVRIIRQLSGKSRSSRLIPNVFQKAPKSQGCSVTYFSDGATETVQWTVGSGPVETLRGVDVFDAGCGEIYLENEMQATYTPAPVVLLESLVDTCRRVRACLVAAQILWPGSEAFFSHSLT